MHTYEIICDGEKAFYCTGCRFQFDRANRVVSIYAHRDATDAVATYFNVIGIHAISVGRTAHDYDAETNEVAS